MASGRGRTWCEILALEGSTGEISIVVERRHPGLVVDRMRFLPLRRRDAQQFALYDSPRQPCGPIRVPLNLPPAKHDPLRRTRKPIDANAGWFAPYIAVQIEIRGKVVPLVCPASPGKTRF